MIDSGINHCRDECGIISDEYSIEFLSTIFRVDEAIENGFWADSVEFAMQGSAMISWHAPQHLRSIKFNSILVSRNEGDHQ